MTTPTDARRERRDSRRSLAVTTAIIISTTGARFKRAAKPIVGVVIALQAVALVSFIYEEALQAAGFGAYSALLSEDQALAIDAIEQFESIMHRAQKFQSRWGWISFWAHGAYYTYFYRSAPTQLAGFYGRGKGLGLWGDDAGRFKVIDGQFIDTWKLDPIGRLLARGFDPDLLEDADYKEEAERQTPRP